MAHPAPAAPAEDGLIYRNPGITATVITILVAAVFLGALYRSATGGHAAPAHGGETAPAGH